MPKNAGKVKITIRIPARPYDRSKGTYGSKSTPTDVDEAGEARSSNSEVDNTRLVVTKEYCCFCGDLIRQNAAGICGDCGAYVCLQTEPHGNGCIKLQTLSSDVLFLCPVCDAKKCRNTPESQRCGLPYAFIGYGGRKQAKLTWPLLLVNLNLSTRFENLISGSLHQDFNNDHYMIAPENLQLVDIELKANGQPQALEHAKAGTNFVVRSIKDKVPANCFVIVDTHADTHTGGLQWSGGTTNPRVAPATQVLEQFMGEKLLQAMRQTAVAAAGFARPASGTWYEDSPYFRGGWRGLIVASCAPAVRAARGFSDLKSLVQRELFDFVLAFSGSSTISGYVKNAISHAIQAVAVNKTGGLWDMLAQAVGKDPHVLEMNTAVIICKERGEVLFCRQIGRHCPPLRVWGHEFSACATPGCRPSAYDFLIRDNHSGVRMICRLCGWSSVALKQCDMHGMLFMLGRNTPNVFWHDYPPSEELKDVFVRISKSRTEVAN